MTTDSAAPVDGSQERRVAVFGHVNLEVAIEVGAFPLTYEPNRTLNDGIHVSPAGTAYNVAIGLWRLGHQIDLCVSQGAPDDPAAAFVAATHPHDPRLRIVPAPIPRQPVTAVLLGGGDGQRMIFNDHRGCDTWTHDPGHAAEIARHADLVVLPIGRANTVLAHHADAFTAPIATDLHAITGLTGDHEPFAEIAEIICLSAERLTTPVEDFLDQAMTRWAARIIVVSQGADGATIAVRGDADLHHTPAVRVGPVASTLGAGDALCAAFLDGHLRGLPPRTALRRATFAAAAKIRAVGGAQGLVTAEELDVLRSGGGGDGVR